MFRLVGKKNNNYLVLDTDDGVVDELNYSQILEYLEYGIEIEGCMKTTRGLKTVLSNLIKCNKVYVFYIDFILNYIGDYFVSFIIIWFMLDDML